MKLTPAQYIHAACGTIVAVAGALAALPTATFGAQATGEIAAICGIVSVGALVFDKLTSGQIPASTPGSTPTA